LVLHWIGTDQLIVDLVPRTEDGHVDAGDIQVLGVGFQVLRPRLREWRVLTGFLPIRSNRELPVAVSTKADAVPSTNLVKQQRGIRLKVEIEKTRAEVSAGDVMSASWRLLGHFHCGR
jgi:hypothetical protein